MLIRIGEAIFETDFSEKDIRYFYGMGVGVGVYEIVNEGARYVMENRHTIDNHPAGSRMALVKRDIYVPEVVDGKLTLRRE